MPFISASAISPYNSIRGGAAGEALDPILAFSPFNVWDSEHAVIDGNNTTFTDFNNVGAAYDLANPTATSQPLYIASDSNFNNLPSFDFSGVDDYVVGTAANYRNSDTSGAFISVYKLDNGTRFSPIVVSSSSTNNYVGFSVVSSNTYRVIAVSGPSRSWRGSTNVNNTISSYAVANVGTGSSYKQWINEDPQTITMVGAGANDGFIWTDAEAFNTISVGALVRQGEASNFSGIKWAFSGYFPYTSDSQIDDIMAYLVTKYGL
jgi:hypothetical protein